MTTPKQSLYEFDLEKTRQNKARLEKNQNLMYWYQELYRELFQAIPNISQKRVLEIGSGTSPLKHFLPNVITSDILQLDYLDLVFDCHKVADCSQIPDHSIEVLTLTNVLHHLRDPLQFLKGAKKKLTQKGQVMIVEPYFSLISYPMYKLLHHEPVDFNINRPRLNNIDGPLSSANQAMPYMIFFRRSEWLKELSDYYALDKTSIRFFTSMAYPLTGGISHTLSIPRWIYRSFFCLDRFLAKKIPKLFASFFCVSLNIGDNR